MLVVTIARDVKNRINGYDVSRDKLYFEDEYECNEFINGRRAYDYLDCIVKLRKNEHVISVKNCD